MTMLDRNDNWPFYTRLALGLAQGGALYWVSNLRLYDPQFGFEEDQWRNAVTMMRTMVVFTPLPLLFGLGNLPLGRLAVWTGLTALMLAVVGWLAPAPVWSGAPPVITVWLFSLIVIFIVHEFLQASHHDRRLVGRYETYFDYAWRHGFQAALAFIFVGAFWAVISLGAWLFWIIGILWVYDTIFSDEFGWIASATAFALAIHWTDAASDLTRGARQIGLTLLSWLAILMTLILSTFLVALIFTGLDPLWDTNNATVLLLNAAAAMILLINAAFQAGAPPESALVKSIVRFSAFPLAGTTILAAMGLWLRIDQYGLTPARVLAGAELLIVGTYAVGYVAAASRRGDWMGLVKPVNIGTAAFVAAILLALMTPIADPARLSVSNQVARLDAERVDPDDFDFGFLASDRSRQWGRRALEELKSRTGSPRNDRIAHLATHLGDPLQTRDRGQQSFNERRSALRLLGPGVLPDAALLPLGSPDPVGECLVQKRRFAEEVASAEEARRKNDDPSSASSIQVPSDWHDGLCPARLIDLDLDGDMDLLLWTNQSNWNVFTEIVLSAVMQEAPEQWTAKGSFTVRKSIAAIDYSQMTVDEKRRGIAAIETAFGAATAVKPDRRDLLIDDQRVQIMPPLRQHHSQDEMRAGLILPTGTEPPAAVLRDHVSTNILSGCVSSTGRPPDPTVQCHGRYLDVTDGQGDEFVVLRISDGVRHVVAQVYENTDTGWRAIGQGELWQADDVSKKKNTAAENEKLIREAQNRIIETVGTTAPVLANLYFEGIRTYFDYRQPDPPRIR